MSGAVVSGGGAGWDGGFSPFGLHHLVVVLLCVAVAWWVILLGRRWCGTGRERVLRGCWAWGTLAVALAVDVYWAMPSRFSIGESLPLHLCDLAAHAAPLLMLSGRRWGSTLLFFWGIGLSTQGFITPTLEQGPSDVFYWLYWLQHLGVVGGGVYVAAVGGYRPGVRDVALAFCVTAALGFVMIGVDQALGVNYMYVGDRLPDRPTLLDALGPWPSRLVWLGLLVLVAFALTWAGSELLHRVGGWFGGGRSCSREQS